MTLNKKKKKGAEGEGRSGGGEKGTKEGGEWWTMSHRRAVHTQSFHGGSILHPRLRVPNEKFRLGSQIIRSCCDVEQEERRKKEIVKYELGEDRAHSESPCHYLTHNSVLHAICTEERRGIGVLLLWACCFEGTVVMLRHLM